MRSRQRTILAAMALAFAPLIAAAAGIDPAAPHSHEQFIDRLRAEEKRGAEKIVALYDDHLRHHPMDFRAAIERCRFLEGALLVGEEDENPLQPELDACLADLEHRFPQQAEVVLFGITRSGTVEAGESLLDNPQLDWPNEAKAALHAHLARRLRYRKGKSADASRHALEAMRLDPSLDLSVIVASDSRSRGDKEAARSILLQHLEDDGDPWALSQKIDELVALEDYADAERAIALYESRTGTPVESLRKGATFLGLGRLDEARAQYATASAGAKNPDVLRKLLEIDTARGDEAAAVASYGALRDLGVQQDPLLLRRLHLAARFPSAPWQGRDFVGLLALLGALAASTLIPLAWLLPLEYVELRRRARAAPPVISAWRWRDAWYACAVTLVAQIGAGMLLIDPADPASDFASAARASVTPTMLVVAVLVAVVGLIPLAWRRRATWRGEWSLARTIGAALITILALRLVLALWLMTSGTIQREDLVLEEAIAGAGMELGWPVLWLLVAIAAPFYEELVFRGALLGAVQRVLPFWGSNLLQATLFALVHGSAKLFVFYLGMGLALGGLQRRSQGLFAPFVAHALNNAMALAILEWMR